MSNDAFEAPEFVVTVRDPEVAVIIPATTFPTLIFGVPARL